MNSRYYTDPGMAKTYTGRPHCPCCQPKIGKVCTGDRADAVKARRYVRRKNRQNLKKEDY